MPGTMNKLLGSKPGHAYSMRADQLVHDLDGLQGQHWGRRAPFPGSSVVWDRSCSGSGANCLTECRSGSGSSGGGRGGTCPHAVRKAGADGRERLVNYAPFFAEGGESYAVRAGTGDTAKEVMVELFTWLADLPTPDVPLSGHYSTTQLAAGSVDEFQAESGWPPVMVEDLLRPGGVLPTYFNSGNQVQDLLLIGFSEYMAVVDNALYTSFLLDPAVALEDDATASRFEAGFAELVANLTRGFDRVTAKYGGRLSQLKRWRSSLNRPELTDAQLCDLINSNGVAYTGPECAPADDGGGDDTAIIVVCLAAALLLIIGGSYEGARQYKDHTARNAPADFDHQLELLRETGGAAEGQLAAARVPREMPRHWLGLIDRLGSGQFGEVWKGMLSDGDNPNATEFLVACKVVKPPQVGVGKTGASMAEDELLQEALLMAQVDKHRHLVQIIGVITRGHPKILVLSYAEHGELQGALKKRAADGQAFALPEKTRFCAEIAAGMEHLAKQNFVHRDLAARNILLASGMVCKVQRAPTP